MADFRQNRPAVGETDSLDIGDLLVHGHLQRFPMAVGGDKLTGYENHYDWDCHHAAGKFHLVLWQADGVDNDRHHPDFDCLLNWTETIDQRHYTVRH